MKDAQYTNTELAALEKLEEDCIITMFDTRDKRYVLGKFLKLAFNLGLGRKKQ